MFDRSEPKRHVPPAGQGLTSSLPVTPYVNRSAVGEPENVTSNPANSAVTSCPSNAAEDIFQVPEILFSCFSFSDGSFSLLQPDRKSAVKPSVMISMLLNNFMLITI